jgi:hypothetical protein
MQKTLFQRGFDYTRENKCGQLNSIRGKFGYTRSARHAVVSCGKHHRCFEIKDVLAFDYVGLVIK